MRNLLREQVDGELLKWSVGHAIFCPFTGKVMDFRTAVLIEVEGNAPVVSSVDAFELSADALVERFADRRIEILDGRGYVKDSGKAKRWVLNDPPPVELEGQEDMGW